MPTWNHDGDPVSCLMVNDTVNKFKVCTYVAMYRFLLYFSFLFTYFVVFTVHTYLCLFPKVTVVF